jgi:hypothetical protein
MRNIENRRIKGNILYIPRDIKSVFGNKDDDLIVELVCATEKLLILPVTEANIINEGKKLLTYGKLNFKMNDRWFCIMKGRHGILSIPTSEKKKLFYKQEDVWNLFYDNISNCLIYARVETELTSGV